MINGRAVKGFLFAFLCVLAGGFITLTSAFFLVGAALILLGLIIGFITLGL